MRSDANGGIVPLAMIIDCDGHILEPPDLWEKYLEPRYRDRAIRIRVGDDAFEYLEIDGKRAVLPRPGQLGNLGGMGQRVDEAKHLRDAVLPAMAQVRETADTLEGVVADDLWPLPTYQEMLFIR